MKIQNNQPLNIFPWQDSFFSKQDVERILKRYILANTIPEYSQEEKSEYKKITDAAKYELSHRSYPFEAVAGEDERLMVLGPVDRFEPYKTANKGKPEDPKYLLVEDSEGERSIRIATQLKYVVTDDYLMPRPKEPKSKRRISTNFDRILRKHQGRKPLEDMSKIEIFLEVRQRIVDDFVIVREEVKNRDIYEYVWERACDPLDPLNEVYRILLEKKSENCCYEKYLNKVKTRKGGPSVPHAECGGIFRGGFPFVIEGRCADVSMAEPLLNFPKILAVS
jgi:hypothetical protein